jgi:SAM-dependent methyltransferase
MTAAQLETARAHVNDMTSTLGYKQPNLQFVEGMIEFLSAAGVKPSSMDLIISNCVINLSPNKAAVIQSCYEALREGGELYFSDVYCDRRLPQATRFACVRVNLFVTVCKCQISFL